MRIAATIGMMAVTLAATVGQSHAQEVYNWSGFYLGGQAGFVSGTAKSDDQWNHTQPPYNDRYFSEKDLSGGLIGIHAGAAQQFGAFVLGLESDVNWSSANGTHDYVFFDSASGQYFDNTDEWSKLTYQWDGSVRLKAGYAFDNIMLYVTGGPAFAQAKIDDHRNFGGTIHDFTGTANLLGGTIGAGVSYGVNDSIVVTGEVRYTSFGNNLIAAVDSTTDITQLNITTSNVRATLGVSFKF